MPGSGHIRQAPVGVAHAERGKDTVSAVTWERYAGYQFDQIAKDAEPDIGIAAWLGWDTVLPGRPAVEVRARLETLSARAQISPQPLSEDMS